MKKTSNERTYLFVDFFAVFFIISVIILFSACGFLNNANWKLFDLIVKTSLNTPEHKDDVVIVCIDQKSIDFFDSETGNRWPWPREFHARLVRYLTECGARAIVFDIIFSEADYDRAQVSGEYSDDEFASAIAESGIVYLSATGQDELFADLSSVTHSFYLENTEVINRLPTIPQYKFVKLPIQKFSQHARGIGLVNLNPERDGIHRRYPLVFRIGDNYMPSLCFAVVKDISGKDMLDRLVYESIGENGRIDRQGTFLINWYGEGGTGRGSEGTDGVFNYYSYHAVIVSSIQKEQGETPVVPSRAFKDKIVLIGSNSPGLLDFKATPFTYENVYPGTEILATALENMVAGDYIFSVPEWIVSCCIMVLSVALLVTKKISKKLWIFLIAYGTVIIGGLATSTLAFMLDRIWIPPAEFLVATTCVFVGLIISGYVRETKEKRFIHDAFGKYLPPVVVDYLIENPEMLNQIEGERRELTVFFSDIADFTTISEYLGPERVVKLLNEYFERMTEIIMSYSGTVDRFEGDAIMAFYGAPIRIDNHAELSCLASLEMQENLTVLREKWKQGGIPDVFSRMGINSGPVMVGNMGSYSRKQYSVVGDTVNLASRLEGLNKRYGTSMIIGENTYEQAHQVIETRELGIVRVVGRKTPVRIYEPLGRKGELPATLSKACDLFAHGMLCYRERKWNDAGALFNEVLALFPDDGPSHLYISRCQEFKMNPPSMEWDYVFDFKTKE